MLETGVNSVYNTNYCPTTAEVSLEAIRFIFSAERKKLDSVRNGSMNRERFSLAFYSSLALYLASFVRMMNDARVVAISLFRYYAADKLGMREPRDGEKPVNSDSILRKSA